MVRYIIFYFSSPHVGAHSVYEALSQGKWSSWHGSNIQNATTKTGQNKEHHCPRSLYVIITQHRKFDVRGSVHHSIIQNKNPTRCNNVSKFISYLYEINFDTLLYLVGFFIWVMNKSDIPFLRQHTGKEQKTVTC